MLKCNRIVISLCNFFILVAALAFALKFTYLEFSLGDPMKSLLVILALVAMTYISSGVQTAVAKTNQVACVPCDKH